MPKRLVSRALADSMDRSLVRAPRRFAVTLALLVPLVVWAPPAAAQQITSAGQVRTRSIEDAPYMTNFRVMLHPFLAYLGTADSLAAYAAIEGEPTRRLAVGASIAIPYFSLDDEAAPHQFLQGEAWVRINFRDELMRTTVRMSLESYTTDHYSTADAEHWTSNEIYVDAPALLRRFQGIRIGGQYLEIPAVLKDEDCHTECRWNSTRMSAFLGYQGGSQTNRSIEFGNYGLRNSRARVAYAFDFLLAPKVDLRGVIDPTTTETIPDLGWGLRFVADTSYGRPSAGGIRFEIGSNPARGGWFALISMGLDLNFAVGGGHNPPK